jgi:hypothetical protein
MWNSYPRHGILEFMSMKEHPVKWENYGAEKPYIKKKVRETYYRMTNPKRTSFNNL